MSHFAISVRVLGINVLGRSMNKGLVNDDGKIMIL